MFDRFTWRVGAIIAGLAFIVAMCLAGAAKLGEMARADELEMATKALTAATNELSQCQIELDRAGMQIADQNTKIETWMGEATKAQTAAAKAKADAAKKAKQYESRIAWLKSQKDTGETCPGVERMIDEYLTSERKESVQ